MLIRSTRRTSPLQRISESPSADVVIGSDCQLPKELTSDISKEDVQGQNLYRLGSQALSDREKLIGKSIKLADLSLSSIDQGLALSQLNLPHGTDTVLATTGFILSGADVYHSLTKDDPDGFEIAIATTKTLATAADLVAPFFPLLRDYQPHIKFVTVLLKAVGTGKEVRKEVLELTYKTEELNFLDQK